MGASQGADLGHISIHALLAESDEQLRQKDIQIAEFLSTLSLRRATQGATAGHKMISHFYPRSPCGERLLSRYGFSSVCLISIHALLAESDRDTLHTFWEVINFYPRSPCGERQICQFACAGRFYFYPRSPCGERRCWQLAACDDSIISIHALLAESDRTQSASLSL